MATTFNWIYLGTSATQLDPTEGNAKAENVGSLVGKTFGSANDPLFNHITSVTANDTSGAAGQLDADNASSSDTFTTDIGTGPATYAFDTLVLVNATVTYADGSTTTTPLKLVQDASGKLFLAPDWTASSLTTTLEAMPIRSVTITSAADRTAYGMIASRQLTGFDDGYVDGTAGGDLINNSYVEPTATGSDKVDNGDAGLSGASGNDDYIRAGAGDDSIYAALGHDIIYGGDGNDLAYGGDGNDTVYGEAGNDSVYGGDNADLLYGGDGNDLAYGGDGNDTVYGEAGHDSVYGGDNADLLYGGDGSDSLYGDAGNDAMYGGNDNDLAQGGGGNDLVDGGSGNDSLFGGNGNDTLIGGSGDDTLAGGAGADSLDGGTGSDTADYARSSAGVTVDLAAGTGTGGDAQGDTLTGIENVTGSALDDSLTGDGGANALDGGSGNDTLSGGAGNDRIFGGLGNDTLAGGTGSDSLSGGDGNDSLSGGTDNDTLTGDVGNDHLLGDAGNDSLSGGDGNDTLAGGTGDDTLRGGSGRDLYDLTSSGGADRIIDFDMSVTGVQTEDQLDVSDLTNGDGSAVRSYDVAVGNDGSGNALLTFPGGETVVLVGVSPATAATPGMLNQMGVPCFASGTRIMTPFGARLVEDIAPGDLVTLADGGSAPVIWHGTRALSAANLADLPHLRPIRLKAGSFDLSRDLVVSPQHGLRVANALVRARHLAALGRGAHVARGIRSVIYHHLLLPRHALIVAEGAATESFYPGPQAVAALVPVDRISLAAALCLDPTAALAPSRITASYGPRCLPLRNWTEVLALSGQPAQHQV